MKIFSGLGLVVIMAANEAVVARMKEIEPEHFFCALLKFSEIDESKIPPTITDIKLIDSIISERDKIREILKGYAINTTQVRRQLRKVIGYGNYQHKGGVIHRSKTSRELFMKAILDAQKNREKLDSSRLLRALLREPTSAIKQVLKYKKPLDLDIIPPGPIREGPLPSQYLKDISQSVKATGLKAPKTLLPQVKVLTLAIQSKENDPILLICMSEVQAVPIIKYVAQELKGVKRIVEIDYNTMLKNTENKEKFKTLMTDVLTKSSNIENLILFVDTTKKEKEISLLLNILKPDLINNKRQFIIAVSEASYMNFIETDSTFYEIFKTIWLHKLKDDYVLKEL